MAPRGAPRSPPGSIAHGAPTRPPSSSSCSPASGETQLLPLNSGVPRDVRGGLTVTVILSQQTGRRLPGTECVPLPRGHARGSSVDTWARGGGALCPRGPQSPGSHEADQPPPRVSFLKAAPPCTWRHGNTVRAGAAPSPPPGRDSCFSFSCGGAQLSAGPQVAGPQFAGPQVAGPQFAGPQVAAPRAEPGLRIQSRSPRGSCLLSARRGGAGAGPGPAGPRPDPRGASLRPQRRSGEPPGPGGPGQR